MSDHGHITPAKILPTMGSMAEIMEDPRNAERKVSVFDASKVWLMIVIKDDGFANITCNMPKIEAAQTLIYIAKSLEADAKSAPLPPTEQETKR